VRVDSEKREGTTGCSLECHGHDLDRGINKMVKGFREKKNHKYSTEPHGHAQGHDNANCSRHQEQEARP